MQAIFLNGFHGENVYISNQMSYHCSWFIRVQITVRCVFDTMASWHFRITGPMESTHDQMETFSALLALCAGNSPVTGEFPAQRPVTRSFDVFFDLCLNKRLSKQMWGWWFETPSRLLWRHCNGSPAISIPSQMVSNTELCLCCCCCCFW